MRNSLKSIAFAAGLLGFAAAGSLKADAPAAPKWYDKVTVGGYLDAYYQYDFNGFTSSNGVGGNNLVQGRWFDTTSNEFTLNAAKLGLSYSDAPSGTGAELDLLYGNLADMTNLSSNPGSVAIEQAYITQAFGPVTFKLGKFGTFVGTEVTDTPGNMNYSRSILFGQIPFYHTGLMVTYATPVSGLGISGYIGDGNSTDYEPQVDGFATQDKDYGAQVTYSGVKGLNLVFNYYEETIRDDGEWISDGDVLYSKNYLNLLASYAVMDNLSVSGEFLYETQIYSQEFYDDYGFFVGSGYHPKEQGYALYANYTTPIAGLSIIPRFEQWYTPDDVALPDYLGDFAGAGNPWSELTITAKYAMGPLTHYLEYRLDNYGDDKVFPTSGENVSKQATLTYAAVYSF